MTIVNLNALRIFAAAARHGSFQRAAEALKLTQGAVSQRIRQLETELGVTLFDRLARGVALTAKGAAYFETVGPALERLDQATRDLIGPANTVVLHVGASFAAKWLTPRRAAFEARFPDLTLTTETHDRRLTRPLGRNELAIWPATEPMPDPAQGQRLLRRVALLAVCRPDFPLTETPVTLETLLALPLLQDQNRRWETLIARLGSPLSPRILNVDRSALALDAAIHGHGVALVPDFMVEADLRAGRLVPIWHEAEPTGEAYHLSWARPFAHETPIRQVRRWVLEEFGLEE